tara:strand:- start:40 stop:228 length:189 start_codon:yes stop_codon:yes gene_type:complete
MIKVKQKVSGCFRAKTHASYFACIRGYITTLKKNKENVPKNIRNAFLKILLSLFGLNNYKLF